MSYQVTKANLERTADAINEALGHGHIAMYGPLKSDKSRDACEGYVYLSSQNGCSRFEQMSAGGGASTLTTPGTKARTWEQGQAFLAGIRAGKAL